VIEVGCSFVVKPYTYDTNRELARWGDTVAVTATGAERLGTRPKTLPELSKPLVPGRIDTSVSGA